MTKKDFERAAVFAAEHIDGGRMEDVPTLAAAYLLSVGEITCNLSPDAEQVMLGVVSCLAAGGAGIANEVCASAALSEARLLVKPPRKWKKGGLASGIKPAED
jgi:hypothetical protein